MSRLVPLYGCFPAGVGTPLVESVTSFLCRLAMARNLSTSDVLEYLVFPEVPPHLRPGMRDVGQYLSRDAAGLDGLGPLTESVVVALSDLTDLDGLEEHTLVPWTRVLSGRNPGAILRGSKRWCARCFSDWYRKGVEPWEPLVWRLAPVVRCPIHRTELSHLCPACGMPQAAVNKLAPIGRCSWCGGWLHVDDPRLRSAVGAADLAWERRWQWWTSTAAARMLCVPQEALAHASPAGFVHLLVDSVRRLAGGKSTELGLRLGVSYATLKRWASQETRPRLDYFLAVCMRLGADPAAVGLFPYGAPFAIPWRAWGLKTRPWPELSSDARYRTVRYSSDFWADVGARINAAVAEDGRRSASEIARSLGVSLPGLRHHYPEAVDELVSRHSRRKERLRRERFDAQEDALRGAVASLSAEGEYPSAKRSFSRAGLNVTLGNDRLRNAWRDAQEREGIEPYSS